MKYRYRIPLILLIFTLVFTSVQFLPLRAEGASFAMNRGPETPLQPPSSEPPPVSNPEESSPEESTPSSQEEGEQTPYLRKDFSEISTPGQWNEWARLVNEGLLATAGQSYELTADLDFQAAKLPLVSVGTLENPFAGKFLGRGHRITGIEGSPSGAFGVTALFGYTKNARISRLGVETAEKGLYGNDYAAGIVGVVSGATVIESCYFSGALSGRTAGGLVAETRGKLTISNCYAVLHPDREERAVENSTPSNGNIGILIGSVSGSSQEDRVKVETSYGVSMNPAWEELFGETVRGDNLSAQSAYRFDMDSTELFTQIKPDELEEFDFEDEWKQPGETSLPILYWQEPRQATQFRCQYSYGQSDQPISVFSGRNQVLLNTGNPTIKITATSTEEGPIFSNLTFSAEENSYLLQTTMPSENYAATFAKADHGQLSLSQFVFRRIDDNVLQGHVTGLEDGDVYTVTLQNTENPEAAISKNFTYQNRIRENYRISGIPEGTYTFACSASGYYPEEEEEIQFGEGNESSLDVRMDRAIQRVEIQGGSEELVDLYERTRMRLSVFPESAKFSGREAEVLLSGEPADSRAYSLNWNGDSFWFTPNVSGTFTVRVSVSDSKGGKHTAETTVYAYREIRDIVLPRMIDVTSMEKPLELLPKILPSDATETKLQWTLLSEKSVVTIVPEGLTCKVYPRSVGAAKIRIKSLGGIERIVRVRVMDNNPPAIGEPSFETTSATDRVMVSFSVTDDCGVARVTAVKKLGEAINVGKVASRINGYAFEGERGAEYTVTATDRNGNSDSMTILPADVFLSAQTTTNSGLAVSKSDDRVSLWISSNDLGETNYTWQKKATGNEWKTISGGGSKMVDEGLTPNTWYEYRVLVSDQARKEQVKTSAVQTNPVPLRSEDIGIFAGGSYGSVYVGETFPAVAVMEDGVDITGKTYTWEYDQDAMRQESPGSALFTAKRAGTFPLECIQTDVFGTTVRKTVMVTIFDFAAAPLPADQRLLMIALPMPFAVFGLAILAVLHRKRERTRLR